jgi:hypothetical protein
MATRSNVTSVEAIENFRASLILYQAKARATLEEVSAEITRTRNWVAGTQRTHWDGVANRRKRTLEEAQAALFSSKMSTIRKVTAAEQLAVAKAKRAVEEAENKLRVIKRWDRDYDNQTGPPTRQMEKLQSVLSDDLTRAIAYLTQTVATLNEYAGMIAPSLDAAPTAPTGEQPADENGATSEPAISASATTEKKGSS